MRFLPWLNTFALITTLRSNVHYAKRIALKVHSTVTRAKMVQKESRSGDSYVKVNRLKSALNQSVPWAFAWSLEINLRLK